MTDNEFITRLTGMTDTLYRVCYSQLSQSCDREDAVQQTLLKAWDKRRKLRDPQYMQTWIVRILINECHNIQRRAKRETPVDQLPARAAPADADAELHDALLRLGDALRLPVVLHYIEGYTTREIAAILRIPQGTVMWRLSKARQTLGQMLGDDTTNQN